MAAPATTTRATPGGYRLENGFASKIAFARDSDVSFWETDVTPPSVDGGEAIDITTMFNSAWRTKSPRALKEMGDVTCNAAYDPNVYNQIFELVNQEGSITVHFPDGSKLDFFGYLKSFAPSNSQEGTMPTASITVTVTNWDPVNRVEAAPVLTQVAGT